MQITSADTPITEVNWRPFQPGYPVPNLSDEDTQDVNSIMVA